MMNTLQKHCCNGLIFILCTTSGANAQGPMLALHSPQETSHAIAPTQYSKSLQELITLIEKGRKVRFMYDPESVNVKESKEFSTEMLQKLNKSISLSLINEMLQRFDLTARQIKDDYFVIKKEPEKALSAVSEYTLPSLKAAEAMQTAITGTITAGDTKQPLPGAGVKIKGSARGTVTDSNGNYTISDAGMVLNPVLVITSIGYLQQEIPIGGKNRINVVLEADNQALDEVVVVGYGTQKKSNVTGAIASFNARDIEERPIVRVDQALVGQMAGVRVAQTTGVPGKGFSVQVRGSGSITASNEPLYVLDGFPLAVSGQNSNGGFTSGNPLDNINPNDIESIQVLKDASAAAIYGSRASNGVVLINTKKGKTGAPKINLNVYTGISQTTKKIDLLSGEEWMARATEMINSRWVASGTGRTANQTSDQRRAILGLKAGDFNTQFMLDDRWAIAGHPGLRIIDWQDELFQTGLSQNYQLGVSGGTDIVKYYVSGNHTDQEGIILNQRYRSYSGRANVEVALSKKLKVGMNIAPTFSESFEPGQGGGTTEGKDNFLHRALIFSPVAEEYMGLNVNAFGNDSYRWGTPNNSSVAIAQETIGLTQNYRTLATLFGEYSILKNLVLKTTLNLDNTDVSNKKFTPYTVNGNLTTRLQRPGEVTRGSYSTYRLRTFVNENTLSYNTVIKEKHDISALAGFSTNYTSLNSSSQASVGGFTNIYVTTLNGAAAISGNTTETENKLLSYFGRVQYAYDGKYLLSASIRRDGSSRFGSNSKWGWFPSASVGWNITGEQFMKGQETISELKLRGSWGKSGNNNIGDYTSISTLGSSNYSFGGAQVGGLAPDVIANPDLTWEKSSTYNAGIDAGFFKSRIYVSLDYYTKKNTDLLLYVPVLSGSGFQNALTNIGAVRNKGWEGELTTRNFTGGFQWTTSLNLSYNTNKVLKLGQNNSTIEIPSNFGGNAFTILQVGLPINSITVVQRNGILSAADINGGAAIIQGQQAGDPRYVDANGDGVINSLDRVVSGHPNPNYVWGVNNTFKYKGFDLSVLVQGQSGGSMYSLLGRALDVSGVVYTDNQLGIHRDRWTSANPDANAPRGKASSSNFSSIYNTDWLYSSNYWRVRNITVGYNLKDKLLKSKIFQAARFYVTMENYFGHNDYYGGYNPEAQTTNLSGDSKFPVAGDYGGMPLPKSIVAGINLTF